MPRIATKITAHHGIRTIWKISETTPELMAQLPKTQDLTEFGLISNPIRQKEWLAVRVLAYETAQLFDISPQNIIKNQWNCPQFDNDLLKVSFSHTTNYAAVLAHPTKRLGIDIEAFSPKMQKIAPRVLNSQELAWAGNSPEKIAQIWCAKEAVYKFYMKKEIDFRQDIHVRSENGRLIATLQKSMPPEILEIHTEKFDNQHLAYCLAD